MGKCPYCSKELHLEDFFEVSKKETKKGKIKLKVGAFLGERVSIRRVAWGDCKMWVCPSCDVILGFSDYGYRST